VTSENKNVLQKPGSAHRIRGNNSNNNSWPRNQHNQAEASKKSKSPNQATLFE
jgi:hypothetical protein